MGLRVWEALSGRAAVSITFVATQQNIVGLVVKVVLGVVLLNEGRSCDTKDEDFGC